MKKQISVICAIVKNEQRFIREWAEHYLNIGFNKLYVFEDYGSETHTPQLQDLIDAGKVELNPLDETHFVPHYEKGTTVQSQLYRQFLNKCKEEGLADWCGFFDVDEFMVFEEGWNLEKLEKDFAACGGVLLAWKIFGANGHLERPNEGVVESYTTSMPLGFKLDGGSSVWNVKSLVNVAKCDGIRVVIHVFKDCLCTDHSQLEPDSTLVFDKAWLNHYYSKSWEDYLDRIFNRGNMQNNFRSLDQFFKVNPELQNKKKEMVLSQRYRHTASTMWLSRDLKLMSGGNEQRLKELQQKHILKKELTA